MTRLVRVGLASLIIVILLSACTGAPEYTPDAATLATREQAEYDAAQKRVDIAWKIGAGIFGILSVIMLVFIGYLSSVGYRFQAAKAKQQEAEARRKMIVDLGNGAVLDLETNTIRATNHVTAPQIAPAMRAEPLPQQTQPNGIQRFVLEAASIAGWDSDVIPRWARWSEKGYTMTGAEWMRQTDELVRLGLIEKTPGADTTVIDGDLRWMYSQLPPSPTDGQQPFAR